MNFNVYIENTLAERMNSLARETHMSRNAIIRVALKNWVDEHEHQAWPNAVLNFKGDPDFPGFEDHRDDLLPPKDDPFA
tara:strand:- start:33093 stop:33329 length:237 start_codon:yes stop_codon:yes gene_type:complete